MLTKSSRNPDAEHWLAQLDRPLSDLEQLRRSGQTRVPADWTAALARLGIEVPPAAEVQQVVTAIWAKATVVATEAHGQAEPAAAVHRKHGPEERG